ncbi:MAG: tyrosine recombinase XerC [Mycoplasmataceae bacterium RV_VA103A]|nr:MAG: tyrosine recombinase XerC [Mycoplasmataceae bacterium RV_VA103A]
MIIINYPIAIRQYGQQTLNTPNLQTHVKNLLKKYEIASIQTKLAALKSYAKFKKWKADWERILGLVPKIQKKFFATIDEEELEKLKKVRFEKREEIWKRNNLILDFLICSGIRVSELVNIKHSDYQDESLRILGKGNKIRFVFITPDLVEKINPYSSDYLFTNTQGQKLTREYIVKLIRKRTMLASIKKKITPHTFRRSFATLLNNRGCNLTTIQKLLGHSQITTTANYIHNDYKTLYEDYSKLWKKPLNSDQDITHV